MSTSQDEPLAHASAEGESVDSPPGIQFFQQQAATSLITQAFEGWELMAETVAETNPGLAELMSSGALLARAAFEEQVPRLLDELAGLLRYGGLAHSASNDVLDELARRLWEPRCPFSWDWMLTQHQKAVDDFTGGSSEQSPSGPSLWQMVSEAIGRRFEPEPADAQKPVNPSEQRSPGEWRIIATIERPGKIGLAGSLLCCTPQRRWRRHVRLEETTYQGIPHRSTATGPVEPNKWVVLAEDGRDFDRHAPAEFAMGLHNPPEFAQALKTDEIVSGAAYFLQLDVSRHRKEVVLEFINQHEQAIRAATKVAIDGAAGIIQEGCLFHWGY